MFLCTQCQEQHENEGLAYTLILASRLTHPAADTFVMKFCSTRDVQAFLDRIRHQRQAYVLTKTGPAGDKVFGPLLPLDLLLLVGSSKAS